MAAINQVQVTVDCHQPERVARFWCAVLGYVVPPPPTGFATGAQSVSTRSSYPTGSLDVSWRFVLRPVGV